MKKSIFKRGVSAMLAFLMCFTTLVGFGGTTAFAAGTQSTALMIAFPRSGDSNPGGDWGHGTQQFKKKTKKKQLILMFQMQNLFVLTY